LGLELELELELELVWIANANILAIGEQTNGTEEEDEHGLYSNIGLDLASS